MTSRWDARSIFSSLRNRALDAINKKKKNENSRTHLLAADSLVDARTFERDVLVAPLVDDEAANWANKREINRAQHLVAATYF